MWCSTECWDCEDKTCEHYKSKLDLHFENKKLTNNWNELEEYLKEQIQRSWEIEEQCYETILDKMKEIKEGNNDKD